MPADYQISNSATLSNATSLSARNLGRILRVSTGVANVVVAESDHISHDHPNGPFDNALLSLFRM